jgi:hypothetical protein
MGRVEMRELLATTYEKSFAFLGEPHVLHRERLSQ